MATARRRVSLETGSPQRARRGPARKGTRGRLRRKARSSRTLRKGRAGRVPPGLPPVTPLASRPGRVTAAEGGLRVPALRAAAPGPVRFGRSALRPTRHDPCPSRRQPRGGGPPPPGPAARPALRPNGIAADTARGCRERAAYGSPASASRPREQLKARHAGCVERQPARRAFLQRWRPRRGVASTVSAAARVRSLPPGRATTTGTDESSG